MSLLAELFAEEKIPATENKNPPAEISIPAAHVAVPASPCQSCDSPTFWLSVYRDGIYRCLECEKPPARSIVLEIFNLGDATELGDAIGNQHAPQPPGSDLDLVKPCDRYTAAYIAQHFPPWPDWSKRPGSWRRELPSEDGDQPGSDLDSDQPSIDQVRAATSRDSRPPPGPKPHKEPNPGCLRDYRGKGGSCLHPLAGQNAQPGDRITCQSCKKFIGYKREEKKQKSATATATTSMGHP